MGKEAPKCSIILLSGNILYIAYLLMFAKKNVVISTPPPHREMYLSSKEEFPLPLSLPPPPKQKQQKKENVTIHNCLEGNNPSFICISQGMRGL